MTPSLAFQRFLKCYTLRKGYVIAQDCWACTFLMIISPINTQQVNRQTNDDKLDDGGARGSMLRMDGLEIWARAVETGIKANECEIMDCRMLKLIR